MSHADVNMKLLIIDDDEMVRTFIRAACEDSGWSVSETKNGVEGLELAKNHPGDFDLVLLDINMPGPSGLDILPQLIKYAENFEVIMMSGYAEIGSAVEALQKGACDLIEKPIELAVLLSRMEKALELREVRRANRMYLTNMEEQIRKRTSQLDVARKATIVGLARLAENRDNETGYHIERMANFAVALARSLRESHLYCTILDEEYIQNLYESAPLHDIGKVGVPDSILLKPGPLSDAEFEIMKRHSLIGARTLSDIQSLGEGGNFLLLGIDLTRSHHERFDGAGYPDGLAGCDIPLSARIVAVADVYDALTFPRIYRPSAFPHKDACRIIVEQSGTHFDPDLVEAFVRCEPVFLDILNKFRDPSAGTMP